MDMYSFLGAKEAKEAGARMFAEVMCTPWSEEEEEEEEEESTTEEGDGDSRGSGGGAAGTGGRGVGRKCRREDADPELAAEWEVETVGLKEESRESLGFLRLCEVGEEGEYGEEEHAVEQQTGEWRRRAGKVQRFAPSGGVLTDYFAAARKCAWRSEKAGAGMPQQQPGASASHQTSILQHIVQVPRTDPRALVARDARQRVDMSEPGEEQEEEEAEEAQAEGEEEKIELDCVSRLHAARPAHAVRSLCQQRFIVLRNEAGEAREGVNVAMVGRALGDDHAEVLDHDDGACHEQPMAERADECAFCAKQLRSDADELFASADARKPTARWCVICEESFCDTCSTTDYAGVREQTVCLSCARPR